MDDEEEQLPVKEPKTTYLTTTPEQKAKFRENLKKNLKAIKEALKAEVQDA